MTTNSPMSGLLDRILQALHAQRNGQGWKAICPAHDDRNPSLSITEGKDGRVLVHCHAGCSVEDVVAALGMTMKDLYPPSEPAPAPKQAQRRVMAAYEYKDEKGNLLYQVVRYEPKGFCQRIPNPDGKDGNGWIYGLGDTRRVLYRLPELLAAPADEPVYIAEGEKDADRLAALGLVATTNVGGAGKWRDEYSKHLAGRAVVILPDNDKAGQEHAVKVGRALSGVAASVRVLALPGLPAKGGVSNWLEAGGTLEELKKLAAGTPEYVYTPADSNENSDQADDQGKNSGRQSTSQSQASRLVSMALSGGCELWHTPEGECFASVQVGMAAHAGHTEHWPIRSKAFGDWLARLFYQRTGGVPGKQGIQDALGALAGRALYDGPTHPVFVRVAQGEDKGALAGGLADEDKGAIYLDLGDSEWRAVKITADGWGVAAEPLVKFRRARGMLPLPIPERGGHIAELRPFVNVGDSGWALLAAFLVGALNPSGPYPLLILSGEPGAAKSTTARLVKALIDPSSSPLRSEPRNSHDLMIAATNSWLPAFDNLSHIHAWLSDALCRLATGGGFSTRELYSNDEEAIFEASRPVALTSIEDVATRSDLLDRAIVLSLDSIPDAQRRSEAQLFAAYEAARPRILGGLLDAVSVAMRNLGSVKLDRLPRMADFGKWAVAAEGALGLDAGEFMAAYTGNRADADRLTLESEPVAARLLTFMEGRDGAEWRGAASDLLKALEAGMDEAEVRGKEWPKRADKLSGRLKRIAPNLRRLEVDIQFMKSGNRGRELVIRKVMQSSVTSVTSVTYA